MTGLSVLENIATRLPYGFKLAAAEPSPKAASWLSRLTGGISLRRKRHRVLATLRAMSDRELADIGLGWGDIPLVFDPVFARRHAAARGRTR